MKESLKYAIFTLVLALGAGTAANAAPAPPPPPKPTPCATTTPSCKPAAPEVNAGLAIVGISLLAGTLVVLRARRRS